MNTTPTAGRASTRPTGRAQPRRSGNPQPPVTRRSTIVVAAAGGSAFWVVNFAISLTPMAREYRAALSIAYVPMLCEALAGGIVIGLFVAYSLQRFFDRIPPRSPLLKAVLLSGVVLVAVTLLVEVPAKLIAPPVPDVRHFLVALLFNALRILALGTAVGAVGRRLLDQPRGGSSGR